MAIMTRDGKELLPNEKIMYISCLMMRPSTIMIDCDSAAMDDFTMRLLCNEEIITVNQDALGKPAANIFRTDSWDIQLSLSGDL
ncbi:MAG: hypothetical protein A2283_03325 [Lentisphaerae bacterium RIFOXYA12_FULL_48_11]|nr:MAG: hypothetical protein A2283_03325 [Lentisphaerae bacterium RIFOXYA12_FULL_48_11]